MTFLLQRWIRFSIGVVMLGGCASRAVVDYEVDADTTDAAPLDASEEMNDAGTHVDATRLDASTRDEDASVRVPDAEIASDAATSDAATSDAATSDAATSDAATSDASVEPGPPVLLASNTYSSCTVASGDVLCWGDDSSGQLGGAGDDECTYTHKQCSREAIAVSSITSPASVSVGAKHACALLADHTVRCWGDSTGGQLGDGFMIEGSRSPQTVASLTSAVQIASGGHHSCAVRDNGTVVCWGYGAYGQLGSYGTSPCYVTSARESCAPSPIPVAGIDEVAQVVTGWNHTCALRTNGTVFCWGNNNANELGVAGESRSTPAQVPGLVDVVRIAAGIVHTCAVRANGTAACWGANRYARLGDGTSTARVGPVDVVDLDDAIDITAGNAHTCALLADGRVKCWGFNATGECGAETGTRCSDGGTLYACERHPTTVGGFSGRVVALSAGANHTCAILESGVVQCVGDNYSGQLGIGSESPGSSRVPLTVVGVP